MSVQRQIRTLMSKNFRILFGRHALGTLLIAFVVPIALTALFSFAKNLFVSPAQYGVGDARPIRSLPDALALAAKDSRKTVVFVNNGFTTGVINDVIDDLSKTVSSAGANPVTLTSEDPLATVCRSTLRGVSTCYGAVVFHSSPDQGSDGSWNYTIRLDGALNALRIHVDKTDNDAEVYLLPLKKAVDTAISNIDEAAEPLPDAMNSIPYTSMTKKERENEIIRLYQKTVINWMGVTLAASVIFITYHQTGFLSQEKESGMACLIDAMMPTKKRWHGMCMRMFASHMSFSLIYLPGWIIGALIIRQGVFRHTSFLTVIVNQILGGLAMSSFSVFASSFFKNAQLSGNTTIIATALMSIMAQSITRPDTATVAVLSFLFPPCAYVYFIVIMARFEHDRVTTNLIHIAPNKMSSFEISGLVIWVFLVIQIVAYPIMGALIEQYLHGANSHGRKVVVDPAEIEKYNLTEAPLRIENFSKIYHPSRFSNIMSCFRKQSGSVTALKDLSMNAGRGQIVALLGANGSGKSTTLDAISGMHRLSSGSITIDGTGGLGIAPQKNVLWDDLTVEQHITIFNHLKAPQQRATKAEIRELIKAIDLDKKRTACAGTLSGGQKRKLQLGMMLTGGSAVCCVDEVSSGIDPLSRRKIWDILLAERGKRTMILTTHFLDEADLLADHIVVLSKGTLKAEGVSAKLKDELGGGYRVHVTTHGRTHEAPDVPGVDKYASFDVVSYIAPSSALAAEVLRALEAANLYDYRFSGPTIEDVFLKLADEIRQESVGPDFVLDKQALEKHDSTISDKNSSAVSNRGGSEKSGSEKDGRLMLTEGRQIGYGRQIQVLAHKRLTVLKTNWVPHLIAFVLPIFAACLTFLFVRNQSPTGCTPTDDNSDTGHESSFGASDLGALLLIGPQSLFQTYDIQGYLGSSSTSFAQYNITPKYTVATTMDSFVDGIKRNYSTIAPGGFFVPDNGDTLVMAYMANKYMSNAMITQNTMNSMLAGISISTEYEAFATPWNPSMGHSLQMVTYMCIALVAYPAFFALYPNLERRRLIRGFEYSNGVRPLPLWLAYAGLDFVVVLGVSAIITIIWAAASSIWYHIGYVFLVLVLYGLAATLFGYMFSLWAKTQLGTYAYVAMVQAVVFVGYLVGYMSTLSYAPITKVDHELLIVHYTVSAVAPIGSVVRALLLVLNLFSVSCQGQSLSSNPSGIKFYGGPIVYLIVQSLIYALIILCMDGGAAGSWYRKMFSRPPAPVSTEESLSSSETKTPASHSGLVVQNLTKTFSKNTVVDNLSFDVRHGEVFALLGPNGAGKSTTISMIRGDIRPSGRFGGDALVENHSVTHDLVGVRAHLGVCPQFDAIDEMTVREHLTFYARVRGVEEINHSVEAILSAVGLRAFAGRAARALSGGNKRKLSLGIALMGNPGVVILDEPSSGLDAAAKRIMWRTLHNTAPGRSILLTTHSMEEADALAGRVGIMAKKMLAMGTIDELRSRFGDALHIHMVSKTAPRTSDDEMQRLADWVQKALPGATIEGKFYNKTYHGQTRFSVPASAVAATPPDSSADNAISVASSRSAIGRLLVLIEENKEALGIEHYSVSMTTLDQVFLAIVGQHNVQEENYETEEKRKWWKMGRR
ncbi:hypothetical protein TD95_001745 [Thielaviopsis punctulata]|uniref:ABC transporter domain-containing protein n=1 Tax=Thielaviopsis punctulata TaxID=72032 RepID=A0A0F4ZBE7_9PEZI|nr:hypothetical protein TD95_001745 [Thielaviopsis punctulata]